MTTMPATTVVEESGMMFVCPDEFCFRVEKSETYKTIENGVKMADFLFLRDNSAIWCVEAKSSAPHPANQPRFDEFISDIRDQMLNAFSLCFAMCLDRHPKSRELPPSFRSCGLSDIKVRFVLVIARHKSEWLSPLQDILCKTLRSSPTVKTWNLGATPVVVLDSEMARQRGLIK
jgi:hypothetical protein